MIQVTAAAVPTDEGRVARVIRGTLALGLGTLFALATPIAMTPIALRGWGATRYGEWSTLTALVVFLGASDLGLQTYVVNRMTAHFARNEPAKLLEDLHSSMRVQLPVVAAVWLTGAVFVCLAPLKEWLSVSSLSRLELSLTVILLGTELLSGVATGAVAGTYRATGRTPRSALSVVAQRASLAIFPLTLIAFHQRFVVVALSRVLIACGVWTFVIRDLRRLYPWFSLTPLRGSFREGRAMLAPAALFLLASFSDFIVNQGNTLIVQSVLGGAAVSLLVTHRTIANLGRVLPQIVASSAWPELTMLQAGGEVSALQAAVRSLTKLNVWIVATLFLALLPVAGFLYATWTLRELRYDPALLALFIGQIVAWATWNPAYTLMSATNRQGRLLGVLAASTLVNLSVSMLAIPRIGARGAALGAFSGELLVGALVGPYVACRDIGMPYSQYMRGVGLSILTSIAVPATVALLLWRVLPAGLPRLVLVPAFGCSLSAALTWFTLNRGERERMRGALRALSSRARRNTARTQPDS